MQQVCKKTELPLIERSGHCLRDYCTCVESMNHRLDNFKILIKASLSFIFGLDVDGHLEPSVQTEDIVFEIEHSGEIDELLSLHDVKLLTKRNI